MPLPTSFVVKKGSKIFSITSGGNAAAIVLDLDQHIIRRRQMPPRRSAAHSAGGDIARADLNPAARLRHGVAGVDHEIDDHLFELSDVGLHEPQIAAVTQIELVLLADDAAQQHLQFGERVAELQHLRAQRLPAREGEQLPRQARRAIGGLLDLANVLEGRIGRPMAGRAAGRNSR